MFRFVNHGRRAANPALVDRAIEPRLNQVFVPLLSVMDDPKAQGELKQVLHEYQRQMVADRGLDVEAQLVQVFHDIQQAFEGAELVLSDITSRFIERHAEEMDRKITAKWIGGLIRRRLGLRTVRRSGAYLIPASEAPRLEQLYEKYGLDDQMANTGWNAPPSQPAGSEAF